MPEPCKRSVLKLFAIAVLATTSLGSNASAADFVSIIAPSIASGGDINADGFDDLIGTAYFREPDNSIAVSDYVVFGKASRSRDDFTPADLDGVKGFRIVGTVLDSADIRFTGDINGDGYDDIIIEDPLAELNGERSGSSYVVFGKASGFPAKLDVANLDGSNGFRLDGEPYHGVGTVAGAGDINGDGFDDLIVETNSFIYPGNHRSSDYIVFGKAQSFDSSIKLSSINGDNGFQVDRPESGNLRWAGDVNGDGYDDLVLGSPLSGQSGSGFVVFGKASGFAASSDIESLSGSNGFRIDGAADYPISYLVDGAGDVNGDGFDDIVLGVDSYNNGDKISGSTFVVFGKASGFAPSLALSSINGSNGFRLDAPFYDYDSGDVFGHTCNVAGGGDVNGDGFEDLIIGDVRTVSWDGFSGVTVVFGKASGFPASSNLANLSASEAFRFEEGGGKYASLCPAVSSGDVDGDGFGDVIVGVDHGYGTIILNRIVFGSGPDSASKRIGSEADQYVSGGRFNDTLRGAGGNDVLEGRGGGDKLIGGANRDTASYIHAPRRVAANLHAPEENLGDAAGDRYSSIENLTGSAFDDKLVGNGIGNRLTGAKGADTMSGGEGSDVFTYLKLGDSPAGAGRDRITDFDAGDAGTRVDRIDVSAIDADTSMYGSQAFTFIGTAPFTLNVKGQLRIKPFGTSAIVEGDVNGDKTADFQIQLLNFSNIAGVTSLDFKL